MESEIGFVAANMLSMGPLFRKIRKHFPDLGSLYFKQNVVSDASGSRRYASGRRYSIGGTELKSDKGSPRVSAGRLHDNGSTWDALLMDDAIPLKASLQ